MTAGWCALGALLAAAVQRKGHGHVPLQNIATFVLPDGQIVLDGDTYATVVASDGTEHAELEQRPHTGYAQKKAHVVEHEPGKDATAATQALKPEDATPEELRGCEDTEGWVNGFTAPSQDLFDYWLEAEAEIEAAGHKGVMLWINGKGNTCASYVFMGVCANLKWVDDKAEDWPCMMDKEMSGKEWNHPEENCCACGKAHVSKGAECSNETQIKVWKHRDDMLSQVGDAFEGTPAEKRQHDLHVGEGISLLEGTPAEKRQLDLHAGEGAAAAIALLAVTA